MGSRLFLPQHPHLDSSKIIERGDSAGLTSQPPLVTTVAGGVVLGARGVPTAALSLNLKMQPGGNPTGYNAATVGRTSGAGLIQQASGEDWQGWRWRAYVSESYCPGARAAVSSDLMGWPSSTRQMGASRAFIAYRNKTVIDTIALFLTTEGNVETESTLFTNGDDGLTLADGGHRPALVVLPSGRALAFFKVTTAGGTDLIAMYYSDDDGSNWTLGNEGAAGVSASCDILCAEYVDGSVVLVQGDKAAAGVYVYNSAAAGVQFGLVASVASTYYRPSTCATPDGRILILADDNAGGTFQVRVAPGGSVVADDFVAGPAFGSGVSKCAIPDDDGTIYAFGLGSTTGGSVLVYSSDDHGVTWVSATGSPSVLSNSNTLNMVTGTNYLAGLAGGCAFGQMWTVGTSVASSEQDGTLYAHRWGGWDSYNEAGPRGAGDGELYNFAYTPMELPDNVGWTKTDIAAGATVTRTTGALQIVSNGTDASSYAAPSAWWPSGYGSHRIIFDVQIVSGGGLGFDSAVIRFTDSNTTDGRRYLIRFSVNDIEVFDGDGTSLGATSHGVATFDTLHEVRVGYDDSAGSVANAGRISVAIRKKGTVDWTFVVDASDLVQTTGLTTDEFAVGGFAALASTMRISFIGLAHDASGMDDWTNPTDLIGRPMTPAGAYVRSGCYVQAFGVGGVTGDTWTWTSSHTYAPDNILDSETPESHWRSDQTGADAVVCVLDAGANGTWFGDSWAVFGTNAKIAASIQLNATNVWTSPTVAMDLDATVTTFTSTGRGKGYVIDSAAEWVPHAYKSRDGRRYFLQAAGGGTVWEITDNDATTIYVDGEDLAAISGGAVIWGDAAYRRQTVLASAGYRYMRIKVIGNSVADAYYRLGRLLIGEGVLLNDGDLTSYAYGFRMIHLPAVDVVTLNNGNQVTTTQGRVRMQFSLRWDELPANATSFESVLAQFFEYVGGTAKGFAYIRDTSDSSPHDNAYQVRFTTDLSRENVWGEKANTGAPQTDRIGQLRMREV